MSAFTFTDARGRPWNVALSIDAAKRVRHALAINLLQSDLPKLLQPLLEDPITLCDLIFVICKPQADKAGVTDVDFGEAMGGDALYQASNAFLDALADFTPHPSDKARVARVIKAARDASEMASARADRTLDAKIEQYLAEEATKGSGPSSGSSPESSESTPGP